MKLSELAEKIGGEVLGDPSVEVTGVAPLESAGPGQITFLANAKYIKMLETTRATAVIVGPDVRADNVTLVKVKDPYFAFVQVVIALAGYRKHPFVGVHPKAHVDPTATVGENTVIYSGCFVGPRAKVGRDTVLYPNVVIYDDCVVGDRCLIHGGAVIGADGFGFRTVAGVHHKIPQIGNVVIEDDVEIGPNTTISRAALQSTVVGQGTKIDQQVVIGHNTRIGPHCLIVAQVGVSGSVTLGHHVTLAGQVGVAGHLKITDGVTVGGGSGIMKSIDEPGPYVGTPAMPYAYGRRVYNVFMHLPDLQQRVREIDARVRELESGDQAEIV